MAAGATKQYTAVFAIGAKLLGSFSGAMAAAQQRMSRLQAGAQRIGQSMKRMALMFSGLFAGLAAFAGYQIFQKIFSGAEEAAQKAHDRTRRLIGGLMGLNAIAKKGRPEAEKQAKLLQESNELLAKQQLYSSGILDTGAARLAMMKIPPKYIKQAMGPMADLLALEKGAAATSEDMGELAFAFGKAVNTGMMRPLQRFGIILSKPEQAFVTQLAKAGETQKVYDFLLKRMSKYAGESARLLKTPEGRIAKLGMDMAAMSKRIGLAMEPARAELADAWREILPQVEPILMDLQKTGIKATIGLAKFVKSALIPAFKTLSAWWKSDGGKAFADMWGKIGAAFKNMIGGAKDSKKSFAEIIQEKLIRFLDLVAKAFKWIGDNADWLVPALTAVAGLLAAIAAIGFISTNIYVIGAAAAIAVIGKVMSEYKKYQALLNGEQVSDPDHFTKHWYLLNQTWTEVFAGLKGSWEEMKALWNSVVDYIKWVWQSFIDKINIFKPPKWWTDFWKDQTEEAKKHYDATQGLRDADNASAAEQAKLQQAYLEKYGGGIARTPTAGEQAAAVGAAQASGASMMARPAYDLRIPALHKSLLPAIAQPMQEHAIQPLEGMEKTVLSVSQTFDAMFGDLQTQVNPAITEAGLAISESLSPAVSDVTMQFGLLSEMLSGLTGAGGGAGAFAGGGAAAGGGGFTPYDVAAAYNAPAGLPDTNLVAQRAAKIAELTDPIVAQQLYSRVHNEVGSQGPAAQQAFMESLVNRAASRNKSLSSIVNDRGYFPGVSLRNANVGGAERDAYKGMMDSIAAGSNISNYSTGNASGRVGFAGGPQTFAAGGERFGTEGPDVPWAKRMKDATAFATGGIVRRPTLSLLGEKGAEAVVPLGRGRGGAASTSVNFSPTITINGNASDAEQKALDTRLRSLSDDFIERFKKAQHQERRLSYEGGYG